MPATAKSIDMTNVKDGGSFNTRRVPEGDYRLRVVDVTDGEVKSGENAGASQWIFTLSIDEKKYSSTKYPYRCTLQEKQFWKIRNLLIAAGINVPKKRVKVDPNKLIGKIVGGTLEDDEYEGKERSQITAIFPLSELTDNESEEPEDDEVEDTDVDEPEEEEEEVDEEPEPEPVRRTAKKAPAKKTAATRKAKPAPAEDDEDELEELDIEDL